MARLRRLLFEPRKGNAPMPASARTSLCGWLLAIAQLACSLAPVSSHAAYHLVKKAVLGGDGGWDCLTVDPAAHRLYIARSNRVMVVSTDDLKLVGEIAPTPGVHDVVLVPDGKLGFATDGSDTNAAIFDPRTLKITGHVRTGLRPDIAVYDPASRLVFAMNAGSNSATAIDARTARAVGTVEL